MTSSSIPQKQCSRRKQCINPLGNLLPATTEYFYKNRSRKDGLSDFCKPCQLAANAAAYRKRDKAEIKRYSRQYYQDHKDRIDAMNKQWREDNKELYAAINVENTRRWRKENPEKFEEQRRRNYEKFRQDSDRVADQREKAKCKRQKEAQERRILRAAGQPRKVTPETEAKRLYKQQYYQKNRANYRTASYNRRRREKAAGKHSAKDIKVMWKSQRGHCWWCDCVLDPLDYHVDHRIPLARGGSNNADNLCLSCPSCNLSKGAKLPYEFNGRLL